VGTKCNVYKITVYTFKMRNALGSQWQSTCLACPKPWVQFQKERGEREGEGEGKGRERKGEKKEREKPRMLIYLGIYLPFISVPLFSTLLLRLCSVSFSLLLQDPERSWIRRSCVKWAILRHTPWFNTNR
jgi:hypothetical protein